MSPSVPSSSPPATTKPSSRKVDRKRISKKRTRKHLNFNREWYYEAQEARIHTTPNTHTPRAEGETPSDAGSHRTPRKRSCRRIIEASSSSDDDSAVADMLEREDPYTTPTPEILDQDRRQNDISGSVTNSMEHAGTDDEDWVWQYLDSDYFRQFVQPLMCSVEWLTVFCLWWEITKVIVRMECRKSMAEIEERFVVKWEGL